jgi:transposase
MLASPHLPDPRTLLCAQVAIVPELIEIRVRCTSAWAACPICGRPSRRIHSRYTRTLADLPWHGTPVRIELLARRFFCDTPACPRRVFAERLPEVAATHARKTARLTDALCAIGFALGGEAGSRLAHRLGMPTSGDTLLRAIRRAPGPSASKPHILGVDDWAWRRGRSYGTILCDLELHRPIDLLPERSAETLAIWLKEHPGAEIITRDRAGCYAQGAAAGAPHATQVADRWHLYHNLRDALKRFADRHHREIRAESQQRAPPSISSEPMDPAPEPMSHRERDQAASRTRRHERYERVMELHRGGVSQRTIGKQLGLNRETVRRYIRAGTFPERATRVYSTLADPFTDHIRQQWEQGCHNAAQIARELKANGFGGSYYVIRRRVARWRNDSSDTRLPSNRTVPRQPSAKRVAGLLLSDPGDLSGKETAFVDALMDRCPFFRTVAELAQEFAAMMRGREVDKLGSWIEKAHQVDVPSELQTFADGLASDNGAVYAALSVEWSNGQVEGQVNRLKLIKRQMYGRAGFDLLRQRVLHQN